jgi:hypothetical protein
MAIIVYDKDGVKTYVATLFEAAELVHLGTHTFDAPQDAERDKTAEVTNEDMQKLDRINKEQ